MMKNIPKMAYGLTLYYHPLFTLTLSPADPALNSGSAWFIPRQGFTVCCGHSLPYPSVRGGDVLLWMARPGLFWYSSLYPVLYAADTKCLLLHQSWVN